LFLSFLSSFWFISAALGRNLEAPFRCATHTHTRNRAAARSSLLFVFSFFFLYYFGLFWDSFVERPCLGCWRRCRVDVAPLLQLLSLSPVQIYLI
jgi:hypothetical protein